MFGTVSVGDIELASANCGVHGARDYARGGPVGARAVKPKTQWSAATVPRTPRCQCRQMTRSREKMANIGKSRRLTIWMQLSSERKGRPLLIVRRYSRTHRWSQFRA